MARFLFFGRFGDIAGAHEQQVALPEGVTDITGVVDFLKIENEILAAALREPATRIAVNGEILNGACAVSDEDEIAFMPPFSGG